MRKYRLQAAVFAALLMGLLTCSPDVFAQATLDYGDAPDPTYPTLLASNGASHTVNPAGPFLGATVDAELDGQQSANADGDDTDGGNDDDGVTGLTGFVVGNDTTGIMIENGSGTNAVVSAWVDWNQDGDFADVGEQMLNQVTLNATTTISRTFSVPVTAAVGNTFARFRIFTVGPLPPDQAGGDGEVEDYQITVSSGEDWGDAPDSFMTLSGNGGPSHAISGPRLGATVDPEPNGFDGDGTDDDSNDTGSVDDEDGVTLPLAGLDPGTMGSVTVNLQNAASALLNAWIDFDDSGTFEASEQILTDNALGAGDNVRQFAVPPGAATATVFARFRVSTAGGDGVGGAAADGEVEDHTVDINAPLMDYGDAPDSFLTLSASGGASHTISEVFLGATVDPNLDGIPTAGADGDDVDVLGDDEDGITLTGVNFVAGSVVNVPFTLNLGTQPNANLSVFIDFNNNGTFDGGAEDASGGDVSVSASGTVAITIPGPGSVAVGVPIIARFRVTTDTTIGPAGAASDGEVEDYPIVVEAFDYGDAPDPGYATLLVNDGARHRVTGSGPYIGTTPDVDSDGQQNATATGDDTDVGGDDEDINFGGVGTTLIPGQNFTFPITVNGTAGGNLNMWVDFDLSGTFDALEKVVDNQAVVLGPQNITIAVPLDATPGATFGRIRISTAPLTLPTGAATDGEVEDYAFTIQGFDYGDAPDSYSTLLASDGPRHVTGITTLLLGTLVDFEDDAAGVTDATDDDNDNTADEDGVTFTDPLIAGEMANIDVVVAGTAGILNAWIDFDSSGTFEVGEKIADDLAVVVGSNTVPVAVPVDAVPTLVTYARFRVSTATGLDFDGPAADGEVEDYSVEIIGVDFGDAPETSYVTLYASNGPRHAVANTTPLTLGAAIDTESDGFDSLADGDDLDATDDEDGVVFPTPNDLVPSQTADVDVTVSGICVLNAWMDFNGDGDFLDAGEQIFTDEPLTAGANNLTVAIPATAVVGDSYARFRVDTTGGLSSVGFADDGEVEDYPVTFLSADLATSTKTVSDAVSGNNDNLAQPGETLTYVITVNNTGPGAVTNIVVTDTVPTTTTYSMDAIDTNSSGLTGPVVFFPNATGFPAPIPPLDATTGFVEITYTVTVNDPLAGALDGTFITNSAAIVADSIPSFNVSDTPGIQIDISIDVSLVKDDGSPGTVMPDDSIVYTLTVTNNSNQSVSGVVLTETVPTGTTFDKTATDLLNTGTWTAANGANEGTVTTFNVGTMPATDVQVISFVVTVKNPLVIIATTIDNTASVVNDNFGGADVNTTDNTSSIMTAHSGGGIDNNDIDGDGIPNVDDPDVDGDGIKNEKDPDIDGDGVDNDLDPDSLDFANTGPLGMPAFGLQITKMLIKMSFSNQNKDAIKASGLLLLPTGVVLENTSITVDVGGVVRTFFLNEKGQSGNSFLKMKTRLSGDPTATGIQYAKFTINIKKDNFSDTGELDDEGFTARNTRKELVPIVVTFNVAPGVLQYNAKNMLYTAKQFKKGKAISIKNPRPAP